MPRPKKEINPIRGERLKQILNEKKISQKELSETIHISQQAISAMITGKANVTESTAKLIIELYPDYRYEWLMGLDNSKTKEEFLLQKCKYEDKITMSTVRLIADSFTKQGYRMVMCTPFNAPKGYRYREKNGYYLYLTEQNDDSPLEMSVKDYFQMEADLKDYADFLTIKYLKNRGCCDG